MVRLQVKLLVCSRAMNLDQWADALIAAQTNDGYVDTDKIRYAKLAKTIQRTIY